MQILKLDHLRSLYVPAPRVSWKSVKKIYQLSRAGSMLDTRLARCGLEAEIISAHFEKARHLIMSDEQDDDFESLNSRLLKELSLLDSTLAYSMPSRYIDYINHTKWIIRYRMFLLTRASFEIRRSIVRSSMVKYS